MKVQSTVALVTGANRGIGRELVAALVAAGAAKVYAAARDVDRLTETVAIAPDRVFPLALDVADRPAVAALAAAVPDVRCS